MPPSVEPMPQSEPEREEEVPPTPLQAPVKAAAPTTPPDALPRIPEGMPRVLTPTTPLQAPPRTPEPAPPTQTPNTSPEAFPRIPEAENKRMLGRMTYAAKTGDSKALEAYANMSQQEKRAFYWNKFRVDPKGAIYSVEEPFATSVLMFVFSSTFL